ncbi:hypothetical protein [Metallibacterium scheffleri]
MPVLLPSASARAGPFGIPDTAIGGILDMVQHWLLEDAAVSGIRAARCIAHNVARRPCRAGLPASRGRMHDFADGSRVGIPWLH